MRDRVLSPAIAAILFGMPLAACQTGAGTGAAGGAITGAVLGGPVGAVVGGVAGAAAGAALTPDETIRIRQYVVTQRVPSARVRENITVGYRLPARVAYRPLPPNLGLSREYGYTFVNDRPVLVEPRTREVVYIYEWLAESGVNELRRRIAVMAMIGSSSWEANPQAEPTDLWISSLSRLAHVFAVS